MVKKTKLFLPSRSHGSLRATFFPPSLLLFLFLQNKETFFILLVMPFPGELSASRQQHCPYIPVFQTKGMDSQVRPFKQTVFPVQRAAFALFLVSAAARELCRAPKRCDGRPGHLKETVVLFASCYKRDGTNSESLPLPTLPSQLCFIGMLLGIFLPTTQRVAIICFS